MEPLYAINDLREVAAAALAAIGYTPPESARVRAVPDTRTIRYYTTLGLIDRPAEMRGRTAFYSRRHVLQIVAIKKRQADDRTLSDIQAELAGMTDAGLQKLVRLPKSFWEDVREPENPSLAPTATPNDPEFWATLPSPIDEHSIDDNSAGENSGLDVQSCLRLNLHPSVQLIVSLSSQQATSSQEALSSQDTQSIDPKEVDHQRLNQAAKQLINELVRQKLLPSSNTRDARHGTS